MADDERSKGSYSRRRMLKQIGVAGAVAWATPVIASVTTPAFAGTQPGGNCTDCSVACKGLDCGPQIVGDGFPCGCVPTVENTCFCHEPSYCVELQTCRSSDECPAGWACANSCCDEPRCLPPCTASGALRRPVSGPMTVRV